ncbi:MAG: DUF2085 domain-containing protein [Chloroflexota bacterium]
MQAKKDGMVFKAIQPNSLFQNIIRIPASYWFGIFLLIYGIWIFTPFLAPIMMNAGWDEVGKFIYWFYSFFCHQLPQRSFFLFGERPMYSLVEIQNTWHNTLDPSLLRQFTGNSLMGWKVAWSDRMVSLYSSVWFFALLWFPFRRKIKPISWLGFILLLLPLAMDGITHLLSDFAGIGSGFRDKNQWLAILTNNSFPPSFYSGDALGSFNSLMRLASGILAGLAVVWLLFPNLFQLQMGLPQSSQINHDKDIR